MEFLTRSLPSSSLLLLNKGVEEMVSTGSFLADRGLAGLIRIESDRFDSLPTQGLFAHFNLEQASHIPGKAYGLIRLVRHGFYKQSTNEERLPLLSPEGMRIALCMETRQNLAYDQLDESYFLHSFPSIKSPGELKVEILARYQKSLPELSEKEILSRGVSYTLLKLNR